MSIDKILEYLVSFATFFSLMVGAFKTIQDMRITAKKDKKKRRSTTKKKRRK